MTYINYFFYIVFLINILYFILQIILRFKYKAYTLNSKTELPKISVIVPAYNEEKNIKNTLLSILNSKYDKNKLEVIAINDGSKDNTLQQIKSINDKIKIINFVKNRGKRNAIFEAFKISSGKIIITVDSDTIINKNTLKNLIIPFLIDKNIGGCAGNIKIKNKVSLITKMLDAAFKFGFNFIKPAQSVVGGVFCAPGALTAFRKSSFTLKEMNAWANQQFCKRPANIGEDRALTNILLKKKYKVVYQSSAKAYTNVPTTYIGLCKMFNRWIRGDIRENIQMLSFIKTQNIFTKINLLMQFIWLALPLFVFSLIIKVIIFNPIYVLFSIIISAFIWSIIPLIYSKSFHSLSFSILNLFTMIWLIPYCWITISKSKWGTR